MAVGMALGYYLGAKAVVDLGVERAKDAVGSNSYN